MKKTTLLILAAFILGSPEICRAQFDTNAPTVEAEAASLAVEGTTVTVHNAEGQTLEVFSLTGAKLAAIKIDCQEKTLSLTLKKGCYILKVGKVARKIFIR